MNTTLPNWDALIQSLSAPGGHWQLVLIAVATAIAVVARVILRRRRNAGSGAYVLPPAGLWLALIAGGGIFARHKLPLAAIEIALVLVSGLLLARLGRHALAGGKLGAMDTEKLARGLAAVVWTTVALALLGWLPAITGALDMWGVMFGKTRISPLTVLELFVWGVFFFLAAFWLIKWINGRLARSTTLDPVLRDTYGKLSRFFLLALATVLTLTRAGFDLTAFAVFGGALGVGLGLGLQRVVSNLVSGFILQFERSIKPGDIVTVGGTVGTVREMRVRHTVVRSRDGMDILVPNEQLLTTEIVNWSLGDRNVRQRVPIEISYGDDPEQAIGILERIARDHPRVLPVPAPSCILNAFGESGIQLELFVWINDPEQGLGSVRSEIYLEALRQFRAAGITIPFPQREVRLVRDPTSGAGGA
jgi:small-conductance mechanosensitive channel